LSVCPHISSAGSRVCAVARHSKLRRSSSHTRLCTPSCSRFAAMSAIRASHVAIACAGIRCDVIRNSWNQVQTMNRVHDEHRWMPQLMRTARQPSTRLNQMARLRHRHLDIHQLQQAAGWTRCLCWTRSIWPCLACCARDVSSGLAWFLLFGLFVDSWLCNGRHVSALRQAHHSAVQHITPRHCGVCDYAYATSLIGLVSDALPV
jgi:hypothetical protein